MFNTPKLIISSVIIISQYYARSNSGLRSSWGAVIEEPDRITGRARETRISIVRTVEVRLKNVFR